MSGDDATSSDAAVDVRPLPCDPSTPFDPPTPLTELNTADWDLGARLTQDELQIYFTRAPAVLADGGTLGVDFADFYVAARARKTDPFKGASLLAPPTHTGTKGDLSPSLTADGLFLYFDSYRIGRRKVFRASRLVEPAPWVEPAEEIVLFSAGDTGDEEFEPYVTPDHRALYFTSTRPLAGETRTMNLYRAELADGGVVIAPAIETVSTERSAVVSPDERVMYFCGNDGLGSSGNAKLDVWTATRDDRSQPFGPRRKVVEVSSDSDDSPSWISPDLCTLYLTSDRAGGAGARDLYRATRKPPRP